MAIEVNLRGDPTKVGRIVRMLGVSRNEAVGMIAAWREIVLTKGSGTSGIVKEFPAEDIADFLDWRGKGRTPRKLIAALASAGEIAHRRGTYRHPYWADTPTGWYAAKRAGDRERKRQGGSAEPPRNGRADSAPVPSGSGQEVSKGPPEPPPPGGGGVAGAREGLAEWFFETHPRMRNETECRRLLAAMTEAQAVQIRYCLPKQRPKYLSGMSNRNGRGVPWADVYLRSGFYCEFRPAKPKEHKNGQTKAQEQEEKADLIAREAAFWARRDGVKARLKAAGVRLGKFDLETRIDEEIANEDQQGGSPS